MKKQHSLLAMLALCVCTHSSHAQTIQGNDLNSANGANAAINALYSGNRGTNGGGDQSLQFGDHLFGTNESDIIIGAVGIDVLFGKDGDDILIGGTEDFNSFNRDRAFGQQGDDIFIWTPGDGNDFFNGGEGDDVVILGLIGEKRNADGEETGEVFFGVNPPGTDGSGDFDGIFIDEDSGLPSVNLFGPGFCEFVDTNEPGMDELNLDHLVRFILRGPANALTANIAEDPAFDPDTADTGLRIALHLKNTEYVVCGSREPNEFEVFDLRQSPIVKTSLDQLPQKVADIIAITFENH